MNENLLQLGAVAVIFLFAIKEFFSWMKDRKSNGMDKFGAAIFGELKKMNENHLHELKEAIESGNNRLIDTIHNDNARMIEILGEIKGRLK